jgi:hypothetical protein
MISKQTVSMQTTMKMRTTMIKMNKVKTNSRSNQRANWIQGTLLQIIKIMITFKSLLINLN